MRQIAYKEMFENELTHAWYIGTRQLMMDFLKKYLNKNSKILDAGFGTGGTNLFLKKNGFKNIFGIDNSKLALNYSRKRRIKNLKLASINKIPFENETFDAVICLDVLYHQGVDPSKSLNEIRRVLKKGGTLYLQVPAYNWLKSSHDISIETEHRFTASEIQELIESANFKIIRLTYFNTLLFFPQMIKRLMDKSFNDRDSTDVTYLPSLINNFFIQILKLESKILNFVDLPFGLTVICISRK